MSHDEVYATPGLPQFGYHRVMDRVLAGRNPLTARDVELLVEEGVTHVLDLREESEWQAPRFGLDAVQAMERHALRRLHLPVTDQGAPAPEALEAACAFIREALGDPEARVYVHCRAGMERTAAVLVASYACQHGVSYEVALAELRKARPILCPLPGQERAVREWIERR